jgi:hypothetical protein
MTQRAIALRREQVEANKRLLTWVIDMDVDTVVDRGGQLKGLAYAMSMDPDDLCEYLDSVIYAQDHWNGIPPIGSIPFGGS